MKSNKLLLAVLGISMTMNVVMVFFGADDPQTTGTTDTSLNQLSPFSDDSQTSQLFASDASLDTLNLADPDNDHYQALHKKITILVQQNENFKLQITAANQKQAAIFSALNTIVDKIDAQLLTPVSSTLDRQASNYTMDFNSIPREVVQQCMNLTYAASSTIQDQNKQTREQLLEDETSDDNWSAEIESGIQSVLSDNQLLDSAIIELNCRTTICQVTIEHDSLEAKKLFEGPFFASFQHIVSHYDESFDDSTRKATGTFYFSRNNEN